MVTLTTITNQRRSRSRIRNSGAGPLLPCIGEKRRLYNYYSIHRPPFARRLFSRHFLWCCELPVLAELRPLSRNLQSILDSHVNPFVLIDEGYTIVEARYIAQLLVEHHGHRRKVADILKVSERTLYRKLVNYNLTSVGKST